MSWIVGETVVIEAEFTDSDGLAVDPTVLTFAFRRPGEAVETLWTYPHASIVKVPSTTGKFYVALPLDVPSNSAEDWKGRWQGSGPKLGRVKRFEIRVASAAL